MDAGGGLTIGKALVAHVAFTDDAPVGRIFWDVVGAFEDAVFAADTLVIEVADNAGVFFFFVGADGAAVEALGVEAMVAGGGDGLLETVAGFEEADVAPGFVFVETIEGVAGDDASFATGTFIKFDLEGVLFAVAGFFEGDKVLKEVGAGGSAVVFFAESGDGGLERRLLAEEFVDEVVVGEGFGRERDHAGNERLKNELAEGERWTGSWGEGLRERFVRLQSGGLGLLVVGMKPRAALRAALGYVSLPGWGLGFRRLWFGRLGLRFSRVA